MNDQPDDFERKARARLQTELSRVAVPAGRPRRIRPRQATGWGRRLVGATALVAVVALVAMVVAGRINVPSQTARPDQTAQPAQPTVARERLYLLSTAGALVDGELATSGGRIHAFDPAAQRDVWTLERPADAAGYWIDGAVSPDGKTLYVAEPFTVTALDAATGQVLWQQTTTDSDSSVVEYIAGGWPVLAVSADSKTLYVQQMWSKGGKTNRWLQLVDAASGKNRERVDLPAHYGMGRVIVSPDPATLYYITNVEMIKISNNQLEAHAIGTGIRDAALTPDGRMLYLLNGASELMSYNTAAFNLNSSITLGILDIRSSLNGTMLLSPGADRAVVQVFEDASAGPKLYVADPTTGRRLATLPDPEVATGTWLRGDTLAFSSAGDALYGVAGEDTLVRVSLDDGSASRLLDLPGETVARLLVGQPAPAEGVDAIDLPQATATVDVPEPITPPAPNLEFEFPLPTWTSFQPEPKSAVAWVLNGNHLRIWERSGLPVELEFGYDQTVRGVIEREPDSPLLVVELADGKTGILDPLSGNLATLDVPLADVELPMILSSTWTTLAFKTHTGGGAAAQIRLADLSSGATWTLLEQSAVTDPNLFLTEATLLSWDNTIIFETRSSATVTLWRSAFRPNDPAAPPPQPEAIKILGNGGAMQINPSAGVVAYAEAGGDGLHLLNLQTGQDRLVAPNVFKFALDTAGPFASLAYLREAPAGASGYELALYSPNSGTETVLVTGTNAIAAQLNFVRQGGYLVIQVSAPTTYALVFTAGSSPALVAKIDLADAVSAVDVTSAGEIITLGTADGQQRLTLYPLDDLTSPTVIPIGPLTNSDDPATLVHVP